VLNIIKSFTILKWVLWLESIKCFEKLDIGLELLDFISEICSLYLISKFLLVSLILNLLQLQTSL